MEALTLQLKAIPHKSSEMVCSKYVSQWMDVDIDLEFDGTIVSSGMSGLELQTPQRHGMRVL